MKNKKYLKEIDLDNSKLKEDAPQTTRNVPFYEQETLFGLGKYNAVQISNTYLNSLKYFFKNCKNTLPSKGEDFDSISFHNKEEINKSDIAHELTHAYNGRAFKEPRGYSKLLKKIEDDPELEENLNSSAEELLEKALSNDKFKDIPIYEIDEAISYAVGEKYGGEAPERQGMLSVEKIKENMGYCKEMIDTFGIDIARKIVRDELRESYKKGNEIDLDKTFNDYKNNLKSFFERYL